MDKAIGPVEVVVPEVVIPEVRYMSCRGCIHFENRLFRSGKNPQYTSICRFPFSKETLNDRMPPYISENLESAAKNGAAINTFQKVQRNDSTVCPDWCPITNKIEQ